MATKTIHTLCCVCLVVYIAGAATVNKSESSVIRFHENKTLRSGFSMSWVWRQEAGLWGVRFDHIELQQDDQLLVDGPNGRIHDDPRHVPNGRLDTSGPFLNITFRAGQTSTKERNLVFDVRYGQSTAELQAAFINAPATPQPATQDLTTILPLLITIVTIVPVFFLIAILVYFCHRRRQRRQQQVSLSVNVQGGIRRDSGVRYTRKTSNQSQLEEPASPTRKTSQVSRSNSLRSWMVRAELTATTSPAPSASAPTGSCSNDGYVRAQPNWYIPAEAMGKGQVKPEAQPDQGQGQGYVGRKEPSRKLSALERVLERVPESSLMVVPTSPRGKPQDDGYLGPQSMPQDDGYLGPHDQSKPLDDGYLGPSPSFSSSSYLDMSDGKIYQNTPPSGSCGAEYQNITVTGVVGV